MSRKRAAPMIAAALACLGGGPRASARRARRAAGRGPTAAEFAELKQRVDAAERADPEADAARGRALRDPAQAGSRTAGPGGAPLALPNRERSAAAAAAPPGPTPPPGPERDESAARPKLGTITGHVDVKGKAWGPVYVYVENIKEPAVDRSVEIMQKDRAFVPNVLVVQRGTRVSFPNADPFLHNVFSPSPTHPFDLGSYHAGREARRGPDVQRRASSRCCATCTRRCARTSWSYPTATT